MAGDIHLDGVRRHFTVVAVITGVIVREHALLPHFMCTETESVFIGLCGAGGDAKGLMTFLIPKWDRSLQPKSLSRKSTEYS